MHRFNFIVIVIVFVITRLSQACAIEPWADQNLPVQQGLEVWLDAASQKSARANLQLPEILPGGSVDRLLDGSGHSHHLVQAENDRQPTFVADAKRTAIRFDGRKQWLRSEEVKRSSEAATIFIVGTPYSNGGGFRAFAAANRKGQNDFTSGWTIDLGPFRSDRFESMNPEGAGFGGAQNLLKDSDEFGVIQRICVASEVGKRGTKLYLNGAPQGDRDRTPSTISMDEFTVGARCYNLGAPPSVQGYLHGEISEILVYSRALSDAERRQVDDYLKQKYGDRPTVDIPMRGEGKQLVRVKDPPAVQFFVPGFSVFRLPIELPNINNLRYRPDGKLVAVGYNGNVYLLSDSDGDGMEDRAQLFFENKSELRGPIGAALTPPNYAAGQGIFIASKGKCSLILDRDGDDRADDETIVATGWKELPHNVDSLGVAVDPRDGSIYFGIGTEDFTNAYLVDAKSGRSRYSLSNDHGTIQRVSSDFKHRETVCTGIRFPVGLAFNSLGDLFCTDQEGATWLSNGNPFDELLHIQPGRHYGFPPRHPRHLPNVIDEPSTFDFRPQHQSTCGLFFNDAGEGKKVFGPAWWGGNAITCGYSRGKLYRTELVKTADGYVAQNQLIASINSLAVDACLSPAGTLTLATHSGAPDWGSGPQGKGTLYQIRYTGADMPQPVQVWSESPYEVRIAFDRPLKLTPNNTAGGLKTSAAIEYGAAVGAGDRYEALRPGYQVVQDQLDTPRYDLPVHSVQLLPDGQTMILATSEMSRADTYAVSLSGIPVLQGNGVANELRQDPTIELQYELSGVHAQWQSAAGDKNWSGWLPHLDFDVSRQLTSHGNPLRDFWTYASQPGTLKLRTQLQLDDMLRPAVQPGASIDYTWPEEEVSIRLVANQAMSVSVANGGDRHANVTTSSSNGVTETTFTLKPKPDRWVSLEIQLSTGESNPEFFVSWWTNEDPRPRPLPLRRLMLPWAEAQKDSKKPTSQERPQLAGGNWERGRKLFFDDQTGCGKCHQFAGEGGTIGPELSNLPFRDYESVVRDITQPSVSFNPDFLPYSVVLTDGRVFAGTVRNDGDSVLVGLTNGTQTRVSREEIEEMSPGSVSIMPEGIVKQLGEDRFKDLLTFLLTPPPRMPDYGPLDPPAPRKQSEIDSVLGSQPATNDQNRPLQIVLVAGAKDHGPGEHDYPAWQQSWLRLLSLANNVTVTAATDWPSPDQFQSADVLVFYQQGRWTAERARDLDAFFQRGGGAVYLHYAVDGGADPTGFAERIGLAWQGGRSAFRHGPLDIDFTPTDHPISRNFDRVHFHDESYWRLVGSLEKVQLLGSGIEESRPQPLFWTFEPGKGKVFVSILGHFSWTFDDPLFRILVLRGIAWSAGESVDRFHRLATVGARVEN